VATLAGQRVSLKPGRSKSYKLKFATFPAAPDGDYRLLAHVDADNAIPERSESNNVGATATPINIAAPFVELSGRFDPPVSGSFAGGRNPRLSVSIRNGGNTVATGFPSVGLFLSADRVQDAGDRPLVGAPPLRLKLNPGQQRRFRLGPVLPAAPGTYFVIAVLDAGNALTERDEGNNVIISDTQLTIV
jgi:hypothetical protein